MKRYITIALAVALIMAGAAGTVSAGDAQADCEYLTEHNNPADDYDGMQASPDDCGIGNGNGENGQGHSQADDHEQATDNV